MSNELTVVKPSEVVLAGPGTGVGEDQFAQGRGAFVLGALDVLLEGSRMQLRAFVRSLQDRLDAAWGYQHPLMSDAICALADIGVNAEVEAGPSPGMIVLEAGLPDGTILAVCPGEDNWWPSSSDPAWRFTGWQVHHYDPASDDGVNRPLATLSGPADPYDPRFASPHVLASLVAAHLAVPAAPADNRRSE